MRTVVLSFIFSLLLFASCGQESSIKSSEDSGTTAGNPNTRVELLPPIETSVQPLDVCITKIKISGKEHIIDKVFTFQGTAKLVEELEVLSFDLAPVELLLGDNCGTGYSVQYGALSISTSDVILFTHSGGNITDKLTLNLTTLGLSGLTSALELQSAISGASGTY